jgi:hypothetical protein
MHADTTSGTGRRPTARQRSEALKERIYVTFTALAVTVALARDTEHATVAGAALTLVLTVLGTLLAVFVADLIAHIVSAGILPDRETIRHLVWVSFGSLSVVVVPLLVLGGCALTWWTLPTALRTISIVLVATLIAVSFGAVARLTVAAWTKIVVLLGITLLGLAVLAVELAVH